MNLMSAMVFAAVIAANLMDAGLLRLF